MAMVTVKVCQAKTKEHEQQLGELRKSLDPTQSLTDIQKLFLQSIQASWDSAPVEEGSEADDDLYEEIPEDDMDLMIGVNELGALHTI
jgi:hypothetical protein